MPKIALVFAVLLIALGLIGYFGDSGKTASPPDSRDDAEVIQEGATQDAVIKRSPTALIPAFVGLLLGLFGLLAMNDRFRMHAMHGAAMVALLGLLAGAGRGTMSLVKMLSDPAADVNQRSLVFVWLMALLCGAFLVLCIQSFRNARKNREKGSESVDAATE